MKNMLNLELLILFLVTFVLVSSCAESPNSKCKIDDDCEENFVCYSDGKCSEILIITTDTINVAVVETNYSSQITATGGRGEYLWSLDTGSNDKLSWLEIDPTTGLLRNKTGSQPQKEQVSNDANFTVTVTDSSVSGNGKTALRTYTMVIVECTGDTAPCFVSQLDACYQGTAQCVNGTLSSTCIGPVVSTDKFHCGTDCKACNLLLADDCRGGKCNCGGDVCDPSTDNCCDGVCTNVKNGDTNNCGSCGHNCDSVQHVMNKICANGSCSYDSCDPAYTDCNDKKDDGCETSNADISITSSCGCEKTDCSAQTENNACVLIKDKYQCGCNDSSGCKGNDSKAIYCDNIYIHQCYCYWETPSFVFCQNGKVCCDQGLAQSKCCDSCSNCM